MFVKFSWILAAPATLAMIAMATASAQTPNVAAQTPASESSSLQEMEQEVDGIHQESRELGGDPSPARSLNHVRTRINELDDMTGRLDTVADQLGASTADLEKLRQEVGDTTVIGLKDVAQEVGEGGVEKVAEYCLTRGCLKVASKALGWIALIGDVVEYGGKFIIREINEDAIRDLVRSERLKLHDLYELISALRCEQSAERAKARRLEELRARDNALFRAIATERQRLAEQARSASSRAAARSRHRRRPGGAAQGP